MRKKVRFMLSTIICFLLLTLICGIIYPLAMTGIGKIFFNDKANGSQIVEKVNGKDQLIGSKFIGQSWSEPKYLIGRPNTGAPSNLSPVSSELKKIVEERVAWWHEFDPNSVGKDIPMDLVTSSGSGVDPEISIEAAYFQIDRLAAIRNLEKEEVKEIIDANTDKKTFGVFGEDRVNVLLVNRDLDKL